MFSVASVWRDAPCKRSGRKGRGQTCTLHTASAQEYTLHTDICVVSFVKWCADRRKERMRGFERFTLQVNLEPGTLQVNLGGFSATETGW